MSRRTQITLTDDQYARLKHESERTGVSLAGLVRRAIEGTYGRRRYNEAAWRESFGLWRDRDFDGAEYVERIRRPGLGHRLLRDDRR